MFSSDPVVILLTSYGSYLHIFIFLCDFYFLIGNDDDDFLYINLTVFFKKMDVMPRIKNIFCCNCLTSSDNCSCSTSL